MSQTTSTVPSIVYAASMERHEGNEAKSRGLFYKQLKVADGLPRELTQGIFSKPQSLLTVMPFSNVAGELLDGRMSTPRGLADTIIGAEAPRVDTRGRSFT